MRRKFLKWVGFGIVGWGGTLLGDRLGLQPFGMVPASAWGRQPLISFETVFVNDRGQIVRRQRGQAQQYVETLPGGVRLELLRIPGGQFTMGSPNSEVERYDNEGPQRRVKVPSFWMGKFEVTQAQYRAVMGNNPSNFRGAQRPVEKVSWEDAKEFCRRLSQRSGKTYRLPSEAEWEYACRAGTTTPFHHGATTTTDLVNYKGNRSYGNAPKGIERGQTTNVDSFPPNGFGLYDMHGNVWEWCEDVWHDNYAGAPTDGRAWVTGGDSNRRVTRGGSWIDYPWYCRSAIRSSSFTPNKRISIIGFRVCVSAPGLL